jgi:hypothetical protein
MLSLLQQAMQAFDFQIMYKKGSEIPADFLSRNLVDAVSWHPHTFKAEQEHDPFIVALKMFLLHQELPRDARLQLHGKEAFIENDLVWCQIKQS